MQRTDGKVAGRLGSIADAGRCADNPETVSAACNFCSYLFRFAHVTRVGNAVGPGRECLLVIASCTNGGAVCFARFSRPQHDEAVPAAALRNAMDRSSAVPDIRFR